MALVTLARNPLDGGMVELTLSDGVNRLTITVPSNVDADPDRAALLEVMFNREQERLATARRATKPGRPV